VEFRTQRNRYGHGGGINLVGGKGKEKKSSGHVNRKKRVKKILKKRGVRGRIHVRNLFQNTVFGDRKKNTENGTHEKNVDKKESRKWSKTEDKREAQMRKKNTNSRRRNSNKPKGRKSDGGEVFVLWKSVASEGSRSRGGPKKKEGGFR